MLDLSRRLSLIGSGGRIRPAQALGSSPRVSVVIPCYNYGHYLRECVRSVTQAQPGIELEVIIVDDASTDDSAAIAAALQAEDPRIKLIRHAHNRGHIETFNEGLWAATGEFILLLSADDLATPGALTRAAALLEAEPSVGMVYGTAVHFVDELPPCRTSGSTWIVWKGVDWLQARCRSGYNVVSSPEVMMRAATLRAIGGYRADLPHAGDFEMWMRSSAVADIGYLVGVDQAYYRQHGLNMHKKMFDIGSARGQLTDLGQRWQSFEAVFSGVARDLPERSQLVKTARQTLARQALDYANYAYARGVRGFPLDEFEQFAAQMQSDADRSSAGRALSRRKKLGMLPLPLHPLWAPSAIAWRLTEELRRWRRWQVGI